MVQYQLAMGSWLSDVGPIVKLDLCVPRRSKCNSSGKSFPCVRWASRGSFQAKLIGMWEARLVPSRDAFIIIGRSEIDYLSPCVLLCCLN